MIINQAREVKPGKQDIILDTARGEKRSELPDANRDSEYSLRQRLESKTFARALMLRNFQQVNSFLLDDSDDIRNNMMHYHAVLLTVHLVIFARFLLFHTRKCLELGAGTMVFSNFKLDGARVGRHSFLYYACFSAVLYALTVKFIGLIVSKDLAELNSGHRVRWTKIIIIEHQPRRCCRSFPLGVEKHCSTSVPLTPTAWD